MGADTVLRERGRGTILGGIGAETFYRRAGNDVLLGGIDHNALKGGSGEDLLNAEMIAITRKVEKTATY